MRSFNHKIIELLAPSGNFNILKKLLHTKCDAFYLGGKQFNMRLHRENYNFNRTEIKQSIELAHEYGKKVYITVNNLMYEHEITPCLEYLHYLEELSPDALIIQDMSLISLINDNNLHLPIHSSVMMNVHNLEMIKTLASLGVTRVVTSREIDLGTIKYWTSKSSMEFEYFVHGDMCSIHGSQCYYSNILFGNSSNRGLCMKPCRWDYKMKYNGSFYNTEYPLAVKDMYMYENIPELIHSGITSFKIEGRMRDYSYLSTIIEAYGDAIDRYLDDPIFYNRTKDSEVLYETRKRDFSTAYAFGNPKLDYVNRRYEGTGYFYSTGKVFSNPICEHSMDEKQIEKIKCKLSEELNETINIIPKLSVRCDTLAQVNHSIENNVDIIYISTENFNQNHELSTTSIIESSKKKGNSKFILALPKMTYDSDFERYDVLLKNNNFIHALDGIMVSNLGALAHYKKMKIPIYSDVTMNISNSVESEFYRKQGLDYIIVSTEMSRENIINFMKTRKNNIEIIAHGSPTIMYMDLDLYQNIKVKKPLYPADNTYFENDVLVLLDDKGFEHPVYKDIRGKNHMLLYKDICLLPILNELQQIGISIFRLEISHYNIEDFEEAIKAYKKGLSFPDEIDKIYQGLKPNHMDYSLGSLLY